MGGTQEDDTGSITFLLRKASQGDHAAESSLVDRVYPELRRTAQAILSGQYRPTTGPGDGTSLVNDAFQRLLEHNKLTASDREHFFFILGRAMKDILAEQARADLALKRGGDRARLTLDPSLPQNPPTDTASLELREAIEKFQAIDPLAAHVALLRCVHRLTFEATAAATGLSVAIVRKNWEYACAWLRDHLAERPGNHPQTDKNGADRTDQPTDRG